MLKGLTKRRETVLKLIISEYIATAVPVASETIFRNYPLGVSSATIRNDMAYLEEEGYITRPHTSSGSVPSDKGYRHYVQSLAKEAELPLDEQYRIRKLFHEVEEFERWLKQAATVVARLVRNAALVTFPKPRQCRFRRLELVALQEVVALMVLVVSEAILKRQLLSFEEPVTQERLTIMANKLNAAYAGLASSEISAKKLELSPEEEQITEAVIDIMDAEDELEYEQPYLEGLRLMLGQPEFAQKDRMLSIVELMETKEWFSSALAQRSSDVGVQVVIGEENRDEILHDLSLVFSRYGIPGQLGGTIGVIGPTRMDYRRAISTVDYMSVVLSELVAGVCRGD
ncbi:MAG: heat-inducible transcription repressor HrcA [Chloroflexi bacterium RBG_13_50_10]|nr:MAG: heat-inducible transcription repressor HrcA [Chloroflexi bacterium RBG_13_50_10]